MTLDSADAAFLDDRTREGEARQAVEVAANSQAALFPQTRKR